WRAEPGAPASPERVAVIAERGDGLADALAARFASRHVLRVVRGEIFDRTPEVLEIDARRPGDFARLACELEGLERVYYVAGPGAARSAEALARSEEEALRALFALLKAWPRAERAPSELVLVTRGVQLVQPADAARL